MAFLYKNSWEGPDKATFRKAGIDAFLARPKYAGGLYGLTSASTVKTFPEKR